MKTVVQFGAGKIGRGFMGQLFFEAGYHTVFVEANQELVTSLSASQHYPLRLLDAATQQSIDMDITSIQALHVEQLDRIANAIAWAEVMGSAVGVPNLVYIASLLASGLRKRFRTNPDPEVQRKGGCVKL